jgi:Icc-related predicted phosphoesterase
MRINLIADMHGALPEMPDADLTLIAGDLCPFHDHTIDYQNQWLKHRFREWLESFEGEKVGVCGNHDFTGEKREGRGILKSLPWHYLENSSVVVNGLKIWGSPYTPKFGQWAFMRSDPMLAEMWRLIPKDIDVLMVHGPARTLGDGIPVMIYNPKLPGFEEDRKEYVGSGSLMNQLTYEEWPNLKLFVFGHIHEGYGEYEYKGFKAVNASRMDGRYEPVNPVIATELEVQG